MLVKGRERQRWPGRGTEGDPRSPPPSGLNPSLMPALCSPQTFSAPSSPRPLLPFLPAPALPCPATRVGRCLYLPLPPWPSRPARLRSVLGRPRAALQPRQTVPPSGHTQPSAAATCATKTNTRGDLGGEHGRTSTGDPNFRFEPRSPEVSAKKMPKLKC